MEQKFPQRMTYTQWRRTPWRIKHRLVGLELNNRFGYWRDCTDRRCRRARGCQDYACYWRRLNAMPFDEQMRVRTGAQPMAELLRIGSTLGSEGERLF